MKKQSKYIMTVSSNINNNVVFTEEFDSLDEIIKRSAEHDLTDTYVEIEVKANAEV